MNDEYAKTIVLGDGPIGADTLPDSKPSVPEPVQTGTGDVSDGSKSPNYPAFEDTSWLT